MSKADRVKWKTEQFSWVQKDKSGIKALYTEDVTDPETGQTKTFINEKDVVGVLIQTSVDNRGTRVIYAVNDDSTGEIVAVDHLEANYARLTGVEDRRPTRREVIREDRPERMP